MKYQNLDEYAPIVIPGHIYLDNLHALDTVDITCDFISTDYIVGVGKDLYKVLRFGVSESNNYPGRDFIDLDIKRL